MKNRKKRDDWEWKGRRVKRFCWSTFRWEYGRWCYRTNCLGETLEEAFEWEFAHEKEA